MSQNPFDHQSSDNGDGIDADVAVVTAWLAGEVSGDELRAVETRLARDAAFRQTAQPLIDVWAVAGPLVPDTARTRRAEPLLSRTQLDASWERYVRETRARDLVGHTVDTPALPAFPPRRWKQSRALRVAALIALVALPLIGVAQFIVQAVSRPRGSDAGSGRRGQTSSPAAPAVVLPTADSTKPLGESPRPAPLTRIPAAAASGPGGEQAAPVVDNPAPNPAAPAFRLSAQPVVRVRNDDLNLDFRYIGPMEVTPSGRLLVAPFELEGDIRIFLPGGRFGGTIGRAGSGPGEFRFITAIWTLPGDSIAVNDSRLARVTIFGPDGRVARTVPGEATPLAGRLCCFNDLSYLVSEGYAVSLAREMPGPRDTVVWRLGKGGATPVRVLTLERGDAQLKVPTTGRGWVMAMPFGRAQSIAITGTEIVYGVPDRYEYRVFSQAGKLLRTVRARAAGLPITQQMIAAARADLGRQSELIKNPSGELLEAGWSAFAPERVRAGMREKFDQLTLPKTLPAYGRILAERDGTVWVQGAEPPPAGSARQWWARFDRTGRLLGTVIVPRDRVVRRFTNGYVVMTGYEEREGLTTIEVYRIEPAR
jgi:hypothetical protein